jgi:hypothetical protein
MASLETTLARSCPARPSRGSKRSRLSVKDLTYRHAEGRVVIEVRDGDGPVLRVLAVVETTSLKE